MLWGTHLQPTRSHKSSTKPQSTQHACMLTSLIGSTSLFHWSVSPWGAGVTSTMFWSVPGTVSSMPLSFPVNSVSERRHSYMVPCRVPGPRPPSCTAYLSRASHQPAAQCPQAGPRESLCVVAQTTVLSPSLGSGPLKLPTKAPLSTQAQEQKRTPNQSRRSPSPKLYHSQPKHALSPVCGFLLPSPPPVCP